MRHRICLLALCLSCLAALVAAAPDAPAKIPVPTPAVGAAVEAPSVGLVLTVQPQPNRSVNQPAAVPQLDAIFAGTCGTACQACFKRCINNDDPVCCNYRCHPVGFNPC